MVTPAASVRTLELFLRVLRSASSGHLTPATIDATLREFAMGRGAEYTDGLARIAEDFVNGLCDVVNGRSGRTGPANDRTHPADENTSPPPELFARLTRLYFELLTRVTELQTAQIDDCLHALLTAGGEAASEALSLRAPLGDVASSSVIVENSGSEPFVVGCLATIVRRADGIGPAFVPALALTPAEQTLAPGEETRIVTSLRLDAGVYEPDVLYIGALRLMRQQQLHMEVPLQITATRSVR